MLSIRSGIKEDHTAKYFSHNNVEATRIRDRLAEDSLEMLIQWLKKGGNVGIHGEILFGSSRIPDTKHRTDATNSTRARRQVSCPHHTLSNLMALQSYNRSPSFQGKGDPSHIH